MMSKHYSQAAFVFDAVHQQFLCQGAWSTQYLCDLPAQLPLDETLKTQNLVINGEGLTLFDSAGALALTTWMQGLKAKGIRLELHHFSERALKLIALVEKKQAHLSVSQTPVPIQGVLEQIGRETFQKIYQIQGLLQLIGDLCTKFWVACKAWQRFQGPGILSNIYSAGITALPIIALLSFLIGVVLAYQMGLQLETYGANIFIAYLSGMAIFREFSPLITAIIVAGRTSSAFTAQIGSMKINEEIDALHTMGLSPTELLVLPKVLGLLIIFPLLIFWSDFFSTLGAMFMAKFMLHVGHADFLARIQDSVGMKQLALGLYKAPTFAMLVALVGCFQGFRVQLNADSLGTQTTKSVVQALFLIIIADAAYSVIYSSMGL